MDLKTAKLTTTAKLSTLKQENGNSFQPVAKTTTNVDGTSTTLILGPVTADENIQKKNDVKARSMLLMALPNEHLMTFNQYKDAKTLFAAIQTRFGGNKATKKTQKTLLKQMYENFSASSTESLDSIFNRLQKIVSQLAVLGENISQEDLNLKFLRSSSSEWNTHVMVWRNKPDLDTMSFDDLYNNFKIVEQEVKGTASSSSQNFAFMSSTSSTNEVNIAYGVIYAFLASQPNGSQLVYEDLEQIHDDDLEKMDLKWQLALLSMSTRRFFQKTGRKITINGSNTTGYDKSKVECFNCHKMGHFARECRGPRNQDSMNMNQDSSRRTINVKKLLPNPCWLLMELVLTRAIWQIMQSLQTWLLWIFQTLRIKFNKSEFNLANYKKGLASVEEQLVFYKKNEIPDKSRKGLGFVSYNAVSPPPTGLFSPPNLDLSNSGLKEFQQPEFEGYGPKTSNSVSKDTSNEVRESPDASLVEELVSNDKLEKKIVFPTVAKINFVRPQQHKKPIRKPVKYAEMYSFDHVQTNCNYLQRERMVYGNNYTRVNYNYSDKKAHLSAHKNIVPRAVLMKTGLRPLNTARPVNTAHPKTTVYSARPMLHFSKSAQSTVKRPYQMRTTLTNKNFSQKVNTTKGKFYTARPKAVNTARPNTTVVNAVRANQVHPQKEDQGYVDSGCSRHMTGNTSYLSDFKEFDRGYVTFGGGAKGGKITGKGTLKTGKLDFEDVYFVKELQFNLFSVSQMCDKKNNVLFTDTACFVLMSYLTKLLRDRLEICCF
ncbi:ribonuclease H-like domain-containing protein [Tanacetum coccineum]|uniref:Ribonuclease H-like domain-containing protein n=1 Tax=Tanacetum coccineum TaxID=301880 RepID=A0ABQ4XNW5_9ASTR